MRHRHRSNHLKIFAVLAVTISLFSFTIFPLSSSSSSSSSSSNNINRLQVQPQLAFLQQHHHHHHQNRQQQADLELDLRLQFDDNMIMKRGSPSTSHNHHHHYHHSRGSGSEDSLLASSSFSRLGTYSSSTEPMSVAMAPQERQQKGQQQRQQQRQQQQPINDTFVSLYPKSSSSSSSTTSTSNDIDIKKPVERSLLERRQTSSSSSSSFSISSSSTPRSSPVPIIDLLDGPSSNVSSHLSTSRLQEEEHLDNDDGGKDHGNNLYFNDGGDGGVDGNGNGNADQRQQQEHNQQQYQQQLGSEERSSSEETQFKSLENKHETGEVKRTNGGDASTASSSSKTNPLVKNTNKNANANKNAKAKFSGASMKKEGRKRKFLKSSVQLMKSILFFPLQSMTTSSSSSLSPSSLRKANASPVDPTTTTARILIDGRKHELEHEYEYDSPKQQLLQRQRQNLLQKEHILSTATVQAVSTSSAATTTVTKSKALSKYKISILIAMSILLMAAITFFAQGILHLLTYRNNFGHAPIPKSPSHGVIVAHSSDTISSSSVSSISSASTSNSNSSYIDKINGSTRRIISKIMNKTRTTTTDDENSSKDDISHDANTNYTFKAFNPYPKSTGKLPGKLFTQVQQESQQPPPLRLLLIGDSIARGVGQAHHCNPVLPQAMAKYLSQNLNGRAVYWTTMAEPGASTKWLTELVEEEHYKRKRIEKKRHRNGFVGASASSESSVNNGDNGNLNGGSSSNSGSESMYSLKEFRDRHLSTSGSTVQAYNKRRWIENLEYHEELYTQNPFGDYDIIIVMSGLNDIKRMLVPFLLEDEIVDRSDGDGEDADGVHSRKNDKNEKKERGFAADMKRLIQLLNMKQSHHYLNDSDHHEPEIRDTGDNTETECSSLLCTSRQQTEEQREQELPMIVFPRFPTNSNPVKMGVVLRSIAIYMSGLMDSVKGRIADQYDNVISPEAPTEEFSIDYLFQRALKTSNSTEDADDASGLVDDDEVMVNLVDVATEECKKIQDDMAKFYSQRNAMDFCVDSPLRKLFAPDGLHPSDLGYDLFGQLLAKEVLQKWGHNRLSR